MVISIINFSSSMPKYRNLIIKILNSGQPGQVPAIISLMKLDSYRKLPMKSVIFISDIIKQLNIENIKPYMYILSQGIASPYDYNYLKWIFGICNSIDRNTLLEYVINTFKVIYKDNYNAIVFNRTDEVMKHYEITKEQLMSYYPNHDEFIELQMKGSTQKISNLKLLWNYSPVSDITLLIATCCEFYMSQERIIQIYLGAIPNLKQQYINKKTQVEQEILYMDENYHIKNKLRNGYLFE